jgi:general secretion pathway protein K
LDDPAEFDCGTPNMDKDKKLDFWSAKEMSWDMNEASISLEIIDLNRKFNLNMLIYKVQLKPNESFKTPAEMYTEAQRMFIRLLQTVEIDGSFMDIGQAIAITEAVIDWIDEDDTPQGSGGAERNYYEGLEEPYAIGNRPMISVSELALVKGVTPKLYEKLLPMVTALNTSEKININTLVPGMERMFNLKDELEPFDSRRLESLRGNPSNRKKNNNTSKTAANQLTENPAQAEPLCVKTLDEAYTDSDVLADLKAAGTGLDEAGIARFVDVKSNYYALYSTVKVGEITRVNKSLLKRNSGAQGQPVPDAGGDAVTVIRRTDGDL